ncbi:MAG TPA: DsrE family protein [Longimicrobiales bacterium]|nr:DsrE family protein [Longimicrobiales bacterium]
MARLIVDATRGSEDPERATLPFIVGTTALSADQECTIVLTIEGVRLAVKGYADTIEKEGFRPLRELVEEFVAEGGELWACGACCKPRGITEEHLREGARIVGAANVVEALLVADGSITF